MADLGNAIETFAKLKHNGRDFECENWTESDTRSKFIDRLLIECLGWQESDIRRELSKCESRLDYRLSTTRPCVVVEAKRAREGIPVLTGKSHYRVRIDRLFKSQPPIKEHIGQLARYCHGFSIPFGVLTNGRTVVALCCNRTDSVPWDEGDAVVFSDILSDEFDFSLLFGLLSRHEVRLGSLQREFLGSKRTPIPATVLSMFHDSDAPAPPNKLVRVLAPIMDRVFKDAITDEDDELVSECYVRPGESRLRDDSIEGPLIDRPPRMSEIVVDINSRSSFDNFEATIIDRLGKRGCGASIIVIGNIGVGKTMFRRYFFSASRDSRAETKDVIPFVVDFRKGLPKSDAISSWILSELRQKLDQLDDEDRSEKCNGVPHISLTGPKALRYIFRLECQQFDRVHTGVREQDEGEFERLRAEMLTQQMSDNSKFVPRAINYIATRTKFKPCVILDNADHHDADFQKQAYLAARALEGQLGCLILLMLQEAWYWHFKSKSSLLSSYHDTVFHVPAPRMRDVLSKRLDFAIARVDEEFPKRLVLNLGNMAIEPTHISNYLSACKNAFFHHDEITTCYECLSNNDVRRGLELFCTFVRAGHQSAETALSAIVAGKSPQFSVDEVVSAMACGEFLYYDSRRSPVPNLFTQLLTGNDLTYSRLGAYYLLSWLAKRKNEHSRVGSGYVCRDEVFGMLGAIGVPNEECKDCLDTLCNSYLVQPSQMMPSDLGNAPYFRVSALGLLAINTLVRTPGYMSCVALDTPIRSSDIRHGICDAAQNSTNDRFPNFAELTKLLNVELRSLENEEHPRVCQMEDANMIERLYSPE